VAFAGVGGAAMAGQGLRSIFPIGDLAIVGINAIVAKLPRIIRAIRATAAAAIAARADVVVIIDSPEFTHRVARKIRKAAPQLPIIDYVSPSIWAWRPGRARVMRGYIDHVLALLPFEPEFHKRLGGPPCTYVGHPLAEIARKLRPDASERIRRDTRPPVLLVLPGSRPGEIARLADVFGETIKLVVEQYGTVDVVVPTVARVAQQVIEVTAQWDIRPKIVINAEEKYAAFRTARAALAASGTVTLELAIAAVPAVVAYKISLLEELVARLLVYARSAVLANHVLGDNVMPEFLQRDATPARLAAALLALMTDSDARSRQIDAFRRIDTVMDISGRSPSARAADVVLAVANTARAK
jgi:lipid-A-disaccharide synthase